MENNSYNADVIKLKDMIMDGYEIKMEDIDTLKNCDLDLLCELSSNLRDELSDGEFDLCTIINGKSGNCSENCKFCAQSAHYNTKVDEHDVLDSEIIVRSAVNNYENNVNRFSIVTSGKKLTDDELDKICVAFENITKECPINLCSSNGLLTYDQFVKLKKSGVSRYHNNLETSRSYFDSICTTHSYEDKIFAIKEAQRAGLKVCSGGIFGLGESLDDRIEMAFELRDLDVVSVPINMLNPIANTPLGENEVLSYDEFRRSIAIYRFIMPHNNIRLAGGRILLDDFGKKAIEAGIDSMISGDMLTIAGISNQDDINMLLDMGFKIKHTDDNLAEKELESIN